MKRDLDLEQIAQQHAAGRSWRSIADELGVNYHTLRRRMSEYRRSRAAPNQRESAILHLTDLHYGRRTEHYNKDLFGQWLGNLSRHCARIHELLNLSYQFDELVIALGGDVNDGSDIYVPQATEQDETNVLKQATQVADQLLYFAQEQAGIWGRVRIECVAGNHGRAGRNMAVAASWDMVAYEFMARSNRDERVTIVLPDRQQPFINVFTIYNHAYLLYHGHDVRTYSNIPWYGLHTRLMRWAVGNTVPPWDVALIGHFHTMGMSWLNGKIIIMGGTMLMGDDWGIRTFGLEPAPRYWLFGVSNTRPITWQFVLDFRR